MFNGKITSFNRKITIFNRNLTIYNRNIPPVFNDGSIHRLQQNPFSPHHPGSKSREAIRLHDLGKRNDARWWKRDPFGKIKWPPNRGLKVGHGLNHLGCVLFFFIIFLNEWKKTFKKMCKKRSYCFFSHLRRFGGTCKTSHFFLDDWGEMVRKSKLVTFTSWPRSSRSWKQYTGHQNQWKQYTMKSWGQDEWFFSWLFGHGDEKWHKNTGRTCTTCKDAKIDGLSHICLKICSSHMEPWETVAVDLGFLRLVLHGIFIPGINPYLVDSCPIIKQSSYLPFWSTPTLPSSKWGLTSRLVHICPTSLQKLSSLAGDTIACLCGILQKSCFQSGSVTLSNLGSKQDNDRIWMVLHLQQHLGSNDQMIQKQSAQRKKTQTLRLQAALNELRYLNCSFWRP